MKILRYPLSKKEKKKIIDELSRSRILSINRNESIKKIVMERIIVNNGEIDLILINSFPSFFKHNDRYYPTLHYIAKIISEKSINYVKETFKYIAVDEGALKPLLRGADVMRPGIKEANNFKKDDIVIVFLIDKWIPIVVGRALIDYDSNIRKGKAIENIHRIGDKIWDFSEKMLKNRK